MSVPTSPLPDVSRDTRTKAKAVQSFIHDPSMEETFAVLRDTAMSPDHDGADSPDEMTDTYTTVQHVPGNSTDRSTYGLYDQLQQIKPESKQQGNDMNNSVSLANSFATNTLDSRHFHATTKQAQAVRPMIPTREFAAQSRLGRATTQHAHRSETRNTNRADSIYNIDPLRREKLLDRLDDKRVQQLRGIFAGFDENRDNILKPDELANALLSLGVQPTPQLLERFLQYSPSRGHYVDLTTFIRAVLTELDDAGTTFTQVTDAFRLFDTDMSGLVDVATLRHLLTSVHTGSQLTDTEADDLLAMIGVKTGATKLGKHPASVHVNYEALVDAMMFLEGSTSSQTSSQPSSNCSSSRSSLHKIHQ